MEKIDSRIEFGSDFDDLPEQMDAFDTNFDDSDDFSSDSLEDDLDDLDDL